MDRKRRCAGPERLADGAGGVVGLEQHDADAGGGRGLEHDPVELVVGAVARVVEIMELAHGGDAGVPHLLERLDREPEQLALVEPLDQRVHRLPPGPEVARPGREPLASTAEAALEGVGVGVDETGQERAARVTVGRLPAGGHGLDPAVFAHDHLQSGLEAAAGPGQFGFDDPRAHAGPAARRRPISNAIPPSAWP